jgi:hypothetical protein
MHTVVRVQMFNLPVLSAFAGLFVGCVPPLKGLLIGSGAPLGFVRDCLEVCHLTSAAPKKDFLLLFV